MRRDINSLLTFVDYLYGKQLYLGDLLELDNVPENRNIPMADFWVKPLNIVVEVSVLHNRGYTWRKHKQYEIADKIISKLNEKIEGINFEEIFGCKSISLSFSSIPTAYYKNNKRLYALVNCIYDALLGGRNEYSDRYIRISFIRYDEVLGWSGHIWKARQSFGAHSKLPIDFEKIKKAGKQIYNAKEYVYSKEGMESKGILLFIEEPPIEITSYRKEIEKATKDVPSSIDEIYTISLTNEIKMLYPEFTAVPPGWGLVG